MILQQRIELLIQLGKYIRNNDNVWRQIKMKAQRENPWFADEFIEMAAENIAFQFLQEDKLIEWVKDYKIPEENKHPAKVGVVMAGNIPLVGFHDMLCIFIAGQKQIIKQNAHYYIDNNFYFFRDQYFWADDKSKTKNFTFNWRFLYLYYL